MTKQQQRKAEKLVILVRYFLKKSYTATDGTVYKKGSVICLVRNPEGKEYYVTLNRNSRYTCQCEGYTAWNKRCYHVEHCREVENARRESARIAAPDEIDEEAMLVRWTAEEIAKQREVKRHLAMESASLNGQRGFSLMR